MAQILFNECHNIIYIIRNEFSLNLNFSNGQFSSIYRWQSLHIYFITDNIFSCRVSRLEDIVKQRIRSLLTIRLQHKKRNSDFHFEERLCKKSWKKDTVCISFILRWHIRVSEINKTESRKTNYQYCLILIGMIGIERRRIVIISQLSFTELNPYQDGSIRIWIIIG